VILPHPVLPLALLGSLGTSELLLIFVVVLIVFGPRQLPDIARTIGRGLRDIRRAANQLRHEVGLDALDEVAPTRRPGPPPGRGDKKGTEGPAGRPPPSAPGGDLSPAGGADEKSADPAGPPEGGTE